MSLMLDLTFWQIYEWSNLMLYRNVLVDTGTEFGETFEAATLEQAELVSRRIMNAAQHDYKEILFYYTQRFEGGRWTTVIA